MNVVPADNRNAKIMLLTNPPVIINRFIMQIPTVPRTNPITAVFIFLVNLYINIAMINPVTIAEKITGRNSMKKTVEIVAIDPDALKSSVTFELLIAIVLVSYCIL